jgi:hypothetical protein
VPPKAGNPFPAQTTFGSFPSQMNASSIQAAPNSYPLIKGMSTMDVRLR